MIVGDAPDYCLGNLLWSMALAVSYLLVVIVNPLWRCGDCIDGGLRKRVPLCFVCVWARGYPCLLVGVHVLACVLLWWKLIINLISSQCILIVLYPNLPLGPTGLVVSAGFVVGAWGSRGVGGVGFVCAWCVLAEMGRWPNAVVRWCLGPFAPGSLAGGLPTFYLDAVSVAADVRLQKARPIWVSLVQRVRSTLGQLGHFHDLSWLMLSIFFTMAGNLHRDQLRLHLWRSGDWLGR